jgi:hypothetical protein
MPRTEAGRRHVEWLVRAKVPTFAGELYRSNFNVSVEQIEDEAIATLRAALEQIMACDYRGNEPSEQRIARAALAVTP